jgi:hypothetical protein
MDRAIAQPNENSDSHFSFLFFFQRSVLPYQDSSQQCPGRLGWPQGVLAFHGVLGQSTGRLCGLGQEIRPKNDTTTHKTGGFLFNVLLTLLREITLLV